MKLLSLFYVAMGCFARLHISEAESSGINEIDPNLITGRVGAFPNPIFAPYGFLRQVFLPNKHLSFYDDFYSYDYAKYYGFSVILTFLGKIIAPLAGLGFLALAFLFTQNQGDVGMVLGKRRRFHDYEQIFTEEWLQEMDRTLAELGSQLSSPYQY